MPCFLYKWNAILRPSFSLLSLTMSSNDSTQDGKQSFSDRGSIAAGAEIQTPSRPPVLYSSPKAFAISFAARWKSIWTRRFILSLLAGQVASLCITCTNVTTTELVNRGWTLSTTQGIFLYVMFLGRLKLTSHNSHLLSQLFLFIHNLYTLYNISVLVYILVSSWEWLISRLIDGFKGWANVILRDGWKCAFTHFPIIYFTYETHSADAILGACDVEGNFLVIKVHWTAWESLSLGILSIVCRL